MTVLMQRDAGNCPRCGEHTMMTPLEINALSRTTRNEGDVSVWVCSDCGMDEGLEDFMLEEGATPQSEWPLTKRTHHTYIEETTIQTAYLMNEVEDNE